MAEIHVEAVGDDTYRVRVADGPASSEHEVRATEAQLRRYGGDSAERLIEASFEFLLEREPLGSILPRFELPVIERYFPEYPRVIRERLG